MTRFSPLALILVTACNAVSNGGPVEDASPDRGSCASVEGMGCACGASAGVWRCVGEMPVCVCAPTPPPPPPPPDATPNSDAAADAPAPDADLSACFGPCATSEDCASSCRGGGPLSYCCLAGRCVASFRACPGIPENADLCHPQMWGPTCRNESDCGRLCGASWTCRENPGRGSYCDPLFVGDGGGLPPPADATVDVRAGDAPSDARDASPDVDPLFNPASSVRVSVQGPTLTWSTARTQDCTIIGGIVSVGAEFDTPERATFVARGPLFGPLSFGTAFVSDVRAEIERGAEYATDGGAIRRMNVRVRGMPGGTPLELTALGCVVR